ncbi:MAG TPA: sulfurtransferase TusA family protein [Gammaproteobacteria bacterium]|nr:sulfurtransferase TusA family protein [Gammaproteobacteria bacterium]
MSLITQQLSLYDHTRCHVICKVDKALNMLDSGEVLMVSANEPGAISDIKKSILRSGNEILRFLDENQAFTFVIRKGSLHAANGLQSACSLLH